MIFNFSIQEVHVPTAPAVDTLFNVTNHHSKISIAKGIYDQGQDIFPLQVAGILKFINQKMVKTCAAFLINKWCFLFTNYFAQYFRSIAN